MIKRLGIFALIVLLVSGLMFQAAATPNAYARPRALLSDSLVAYWSMDETSGSRADAVGANDLADNNTVGYTSGKISNAANLVSANSEYLSIGDNADMSINGTSFSFAGWLNIANNTADQIVLSRASNYGDYQLAINGGNIYFVVYAGTGSGTVICYANKAISTGTTFFAAVYDYATEECRLSVNAGTQAINNIVDGSGTTQDTSEAFRVGTSNNSTDYLNGWVDEVGFWKKSLSTTEITTLFNGNSGCAHPFTVCEATPTPTATSTATNTPTATPTFTPTPSATPKWWSETTLTNGGTFVVERRATLGEGFIAMFGAAVLGVFLLKWLLDFIGKHIK